MAVIFSASGDTKSFQHSSRIFGPMVRWIFPRLSNEGVERIVFGLRKCAHVTEYAILAVLVAIALDRRKSQASPTNKSTSFGRAMIICAIYAATDEFHQVFVPSRQGSI